jgi:hypothetical protein
MALIRDVSGGPPPAPTPTTGPGPSPTPTPTTGTIPVVTQQTYAVDTMHCPSITGPVTATNLHTGGPPAPALPAGPLPWWHDRRFAWGTIIGALILLFALLLGYSYLSRLINCETKEETITKETTTEKKKAPAKKEPPAKKETEKKSPATKNSTGDTKSAGTSPSDPDRERQLATERWDETVRRNYLNKLCLDTTPTKHDREPKPSEDDRVSSRYHPEVEVEVKIDVRAYHVEPEPNRHTCCNNVRCDRYCSPNRCSCPCPDTRSRPNTREPDYRGQVYVQR